MCTRIIVSVSSKRCGSKRTRQTHRSPFAVYRAKKDRPSSIWRARNAAGIVPTAHNTRQDDVLINKNNLLNTVVYDTSVFTVLLLLRYSYRVSQIFFFRDFYSACLFRNIKAAIIVTDKSNKRIKRKINTDEPKHQKRLQNTSV